MRAYNTIYNNALAVFAVALAAVSWPRAAGAHFERVVASSRTESLGGAFVAVADDATAAWFNAAGLAGLRDYHVLATWHRPYGLSDVNQGFAAGALRTPVGVVGASWFYRGLDGAMGENLLSLSFARDVLRTAEDASLSVGATVDYARVSVSERFDASDDAFTVGLSAHMRPFPMIGVGYTVRNLNESTLHLLDDGVGTELLRRQAWGLSYFWERRLTVSFEQRQDAAGEWRTHGGIELLLGTHVQLRTGLDGRYATMGLGVAWSGINLDVGMTSHEWLGASYIVTIGYAPPRPVNPYETP
jgi:hypothetical protein